MYKSYQSISPCQSRILKERWDRKYYDEHRDKVREAKSMVDTKPPKTYVHLHLKLKKLQLEEERYAVIERDNRILLEKMSQIMRNRGRVDNHNSYVSKSLTREKRQRELLRVTRENQEILKRILAREPEYNHLQWERDWEDNEKFMDSIARYPRDWWQQQEEEEERRKGELREKRRKEERRSKSKTRSKSRTKSREGTPLVEQEQDTESEGARTESPTEGTTDQNNNEDDVKGGSAKEESDHEESREESREDERAVGEEEQQSEETTKGDEEEEKSGATDGETQSEMQKGAVPA